MTTLTDKEMIDKLRNATPEQIAGWAHEALEQKDIILWRVLKGYALTKAVAANTNTKAAGGIQ